MKKLILIIIMLSAIRVSAQVTGSFSVNGDINKFYPVTFSDGGWSLNAASELELGRSSIHTNVTWRGSLIATFNYHTSRWGNGSNFINAEIRQKANGENQQDVTFIAGWADATTGNGDDKIIIWLKGGGTTYYYRSKFAITATVYDGVANALPFQETSGPAHTFKTTTDSYMNSNGIYNNGSAYFTGGGNNFFNGSVGIGAIDTKGYKLAVAGNVIAESVRVKLQGAWPDFVFAKDYKLPSLQETENHIKEKGHLPGIPSAAEVAKDGVELGEMNKKLLQKIEELTLYLIEMKKETERQNKEIECLKSNQNQKK